MFGACRFICLLCLQENRAPNKADGWAGTLWKGQNRGWIPVLLLLEFSVVYVVVLNNLDFNQDGISGTQKNYSSPPVCISEWRMGLHLP
ncbi:hypothetical protein VTJ04DRAFT_9199 [Mycothermus thermophilus]|uniref:uncharacterized protein n=1 Tax=Humicola insolens TaxID=85995 RepID=UPI00374269E2